MRTRNELIPLIYPTSRITISIQWIFSLLQMKTLRDATSVWLGHLFAARQLKTEPPAMLMIIITILLVEYSVEWVGINGTVWRDIFLLLATLLDVRRWWGEGGGEFLVGRMGNMCVIQQTSYQLLLPLLLRSSFNGPFLQLISRIDSHLPLSIPSVRVAAPESEPTFSTRSIASTDECRRKKCQSSGFETEINQPPW